MKTAKNLTAGDMKVVEACKKELAMNFDIPARDIVGMHGRKLGLSYTEMRELLRNLIAE